MFKATLKDSKTVKAVFNAVSQIISETRLKVDPAKGLFITAMDGSHICLVNLSIKKEDMDEFSADQPYELGLNLEDLNKLLARADNTDQIRFKHDSKDKKMIVELVNEGTRHARVFTIGLIDIDVEEINMDSLNQMGFDTNAKFLFKDMDIALKDVEIFSEVIWINGTPEGIRLLTEGSIGDYNNLIEKENLVDYNYGCNTEGSFSVQFMKCVMKSGIIFGTSQTVNYKKAYFQIFLKSEAPVKVVVKFMENSELIYFTAPRVEEDNNDPYGESETTKKPEVKEVPQVQVPQLAIVPTFNIIESIGKQIDYSDLKLQIAGKIAQIQNAEKRIPELKEKLIECNESDYVAIKKDYEAAKALLSEKSEIEEMKVFLKL